MSEWDVVGVLAGLAGLAATLSAPMLRLNTTMTRLAVLVAELSDTLGALVRENRRQHERLDASLEGARGELRGHETRITVLERGSGKNGGI